MSGQAFRASVGPIYVTAEATGPFGSVQLELVLDTGATTSLINLATLRSLGFDPDSAQRHVSLTTGSAVQLVPLVTLTRLTALGRHRFGFPVMAHALPSGTGIDGLLGLDFVRGHVLTIDFPAGRVTLA